MEKINFVELHQALSGRRLVKTFCDWCATTRNIQFSELMLLRVARQKGEETEDLTPRQKMMLDLGRQFMMMNSLQSA